MWVAGSVVGGRFRCVHELPGWGVGVGTSWRAERVNDPSRTLRLVVFSPDRRGGNPCSVFRADAPVSAVGEGVHHGLPYVVWDMLDDELPLARWLEDRRPAQESVATAPREALSLFARICAVLECAHRGSDRRVQVIHGALSPSSVLLRAMSEGAAVSSVIDFGSRAWLDPQLDASWKTYAAPEVLKSRTGAGEVTPRADTFSLGVMLMELLTGSAWSHPKSGVTWATLGRDGHSHVVGRIRTQLPQFTDAQVEALADALNPVPEKRYEGVATLRQTLRKVGLWSLESNGVWPPVAAHVPISLEAFLSGAGGGKRPPHAVESAVAPTLVDPVTEVDVGPPARAAVSAEDGADPLTRARGEPEPGEPFARLDVAARNSTNAGGDIGPPSPFDLSVEKSDPAAATAGTRAKTALPPWVWFLAGVVVTLLVSALVR